MMGAMSDHLTVREFGPPSRQALRVDRALRTAWSPVVNNWRFTRRGVRWAQAVFEPRGRIPVVRGTEISHTRIEHMPGEWVTAPRAVGSPAERAVLYIHGGGYVFGSPRTHRNLVSRISHVTSTRVLAIDYRLPPEHWPPAPTEDALLGYRHLLAAGIPPEGITVMGDSAGGGISLELVLHLVEAGLPVPGALVLLSPWADLTMTGDSVTRNAGLDPFIPAGPVRRLTRVVVGPRDPRDWRLSPVFAPDELFRGFPPTLIQVGSHELITDDSVRVAERLGALGVTCELQLFESHPHVVPVWGTPESRQSLKEIGTWVARHEPPSIAPAAPSDRAAAEAAEPDVPPSQMLL